MKNVNTSILTAALVGFTSIATNASAQIKPTEDDGIAASPRVRQMLEERAASKRVSPHTQVVVKNYSDQDLGPSAASPRVRQMLSEQKRAIGSGSSSQVAGYRPTGPDGITASPKLRQQLDERGTAIMIAPVK